MKNINTITTCLSGVCAALVASASIGFEDLSFVSGNFENGENLPSQGTEPGPFGGTDKLSTFTSSAGSFSGDFDNKYNLDFNSWVSWAYSKDTDTATSGFGNQYSAITGTGAGGSSNYGVSYTDSSIRFSSAQDFSGRGFQVTNTTYAHNSMRDGDGFAKKFGDDLATTGVVETNFEDFFLLTVQGFLSGGVTGTVDFYLADYRFADDAQDYIISDWTFFDLTSLGTIDELSFDLSSSDVGDFGMSTPDYFAIDNIGAVPEPSAYALSAGLLALCLVARRRR
jgi:hypothetical protein